MADYWIAPTGDDGDTGGTGDPWATLSFALTQMGASDTLYVRYGDGTAYVETSGITTGLDTPTIIAEDTTGVTADNLVLFDWSQRPTIEFNHSSFGIAHTHASVFTIRGIILDGLGTADRGWISTTSNDALEAYDCEFTGFTVACTWLQNGAIMDRCRLRDSDLGAEVLNGTCTFTACIFDEIDDFAIGKGAGDVVVVRNCLAYHCGAGITAENYVFELAGTDSGNWTIQNCIFADNYTLYGLPGSTYESNDCYSSDGNTVFHVTANWNGATDADDYSHDPEFVDDYRDNWHLSPPSLLSDLGVANSVVKFYDRNAVPSPQVIGPLFFDTYSDGVTVSRGTHDFVVKLSAGFFLTAHDEVENWTIVGTLDPRPPVVATVSLSQSVDLNGVTGWTQADFTTDRPLEEGRVYFISNPEPMYHGETFSAPNTFSGLRSSLTGGAESSSSPLLLDLHAPWVREDGLAGGFFEIGADGDYVLTGGLETVKKAAWAWLLTRLRELVYAPEFGSPLQLKTLRPADLDDAAQRLADGMARGIPWVDSARVRMQFSQANHLRVGVTIRAFGEIVNDTQTVQT